MGRFFVYSGGQFNRKDFEMRINYNFPYYQERLSPRQRARMAAESRLQRPEIKMEGQATSILKIRTTVSLSQDSDETGEINLGLRK